MPRLDVSIERWPIAGRFTIARGSRTEAVVVTATLVEGEVAGRGECTPYARYGETPEGVAATIEALRTAIEGGATRLDLQRLLKPGAARNALDCAMLDLEAKRSGTPAHRILGLEAPRPVVTAFTIGLGAPEEMAIAATAASRRPLLKIKLGGDGDAERMAAVRAAAPDAALIADANEAWTEAMLAPLSEAAARHGFALIEQPLPAGGDAALSDRPKGVPFCADESVHDRRSLEAIAGRYDAVNIKLDKTGGLTEAALLRRAAREAGLSIMVGCMVATSLSMAPAMLIAGDADFVDLDGPLLLARDRSPGLAYDGSRVSPPPPTLWG
jgi:L-alanine-DL-glutamate epimerase-like enolase superfamily enzyme